MFGGVAFGCRENMKFTKKGGDDRREFLTRRESGGRMEATPLSCTANFKFERSKSVSIVITCEEDCFPDISPGKMVYKSTDEIVRHVQLLMKIIHIAIRCKGRLRGAIDVTPSKNGRVSTDMLRIIAAVYEYWPEVTYEELSCFLGLSLTTIKTNEEIQKIIQYQLASNRDFCAKRHMVK